MNYEQRRYLHIHWIFLIIYVKHTFDCILKLPIDDFLLKNRFACLYFFREIVK